ncbi:hypothetical protein BGZ80_009420 [Entomortierella chlamydospora]|uniref:Uncharacterized protein n=1 Tax=Entomortierella chlamydospora TaxID=101097 RepID=A0A9P6T139_9FUNG|nr:hypothetical protein BGZ79_006229 [Entomortierella chlamydospora]KAG0016114.1 hypothetical protein BGZ80_009420 [Entomortierella chlamydospora]
MSSASDRSLEIEEEMRTQEVEKNIKLKKMHQPVTLQSAFYPSAPMQYSAATAFECPQEQAKDRNVATEEDSVKAYTMGHSSALLARKFQPVSVLPPMADPRPLSAAKKYKEYSYRWEFNVQTAPQPRMMAIDTPETKIPISQPTLEKPWVKLSSDLIAEPAKDKEKATMARHDAKLQTTQPLVPESVTAPNVALASAPALNTTPPLIATAAASVPPASDMHLRLPHPPRHRHRDDKGQEHHHHHKEPQHEEPHQKGEHPRGTDIYNVAAPHVAPFISDAAAMQTSLHGGNMTELHDDPYKCQPEHHRHEHDEHRRSEDEEEEVEFSYKSYKNEYLSDDCSSTTSNDHVQSLRSTTAPWTSHEEPDKTIPHPVTPSRHDSPYEARFRSPVVSSMGVDKDSGLSQTKEREVHETPIMGAHPYAASDENPVPSPVYPRDPNIVAAMNTSASLPKAAPVSLEFREPTNSEETLMDQSLQDNNHKSTSNVFRRPMDPLHQ